MNLVLIGGPKFLGFALIEAALARGHELTTFNRGQTNPDLFPEVEKLHGDRDGGLAPLQGRTWDAVLDTSGYVPRHVRDSAQLLARAAGHYVFISSISYYADYREPRHEGDPPERLGDLPADRLLEDYSNYGALKALCEQEVERAFGERAILVRPGLIVGPNDPTDRFTYWPRRVERGGPILAPPDQPVQMIDVRDLADWVVRLAEDGRSGAFNATSPPRALTFDSMLEACGGTDVVRVTEEFLAEQGVEGWSDLPCWIPSSAVDHAAFQLVPVDRAVAAGLSFRPLAETAQDVPEWTGKAGLSAEREGELLAAWENRPT
ncbi:MAG TPA: NAD-dependent epimerase/dehydratase family protein [Gaiellaceae bacterium]